MDGQAEGETSEMYCLLPKYGERVANAKNFNDHLLNGLINHQK